MRENERSDGIRLENRAMQWWKCMTLLGVVVSPGESSEMPTEYDIYTPDCMNHEGNICAEPCHAMSE